MTLYRWMLCLSLLCAPVHLLATELHGRVVRVTDGDTFTLQQNDGTEVVIRIAAIDAPERHQRFGKDARARLKVLIGQSEVRVQALGSDSYGRTLGSTFIGAQDIGLAMIAQGLAWHYTIKSTPKDTAQYQTYAAAQARAQQGRKGLWQDRNPRPPAAWRRYNKPRY